MAMIDVTDLTKRYRDRVAINRLTFKVEEGEILGFLGPNGAGKSTTMKILTGFLPASEGVARVNGLDVFDKPIEVKRCIGYLPETPPLYTEMTVRGYLAFVGRVKGLSEKALDADIERVAGQTGVTSELNRLIQALSKGYRQRVGIAQALLGNPKLLILDEPTEGLDPRQRKEILEMIRGLKGQHTVVLSTHILPEVKAICEKVLIIHRGNIVAFDTIEALSAGSASGLEETFIRLTSA